MIAVRDRDRLARPLLPAEVIHAPKRGFVSPVPAWFTGELLILTILTRPKTLARGWWTEDGIKVLAESRAPCRLYSMLVLEIIADLFVDRRIFDSPPGITLSELL